MWARIDTDDFVAELMADDPTGRFHPSLRFVPIPDGWEPYVDISFWWDGQNLREPEPGVLAAKARAARKAEVTAKRRSVETGGLHLPPEMGGVRVLTGIDDQNRIATAIQGMRDAGLTEVDFKAESGWVRLSLQELVGLSRAIAAHVQICFSVERMHHEALDAFDGSDAMGAPDAMDAFERIRFYDINTGWPQHA